MDSKRISIFIIFSALTIVLNLSPFKVPAPYAPFLIYEIWEIPIVTVALIYGFSDGAIVSVINTIMLLIVFPGALPTGPLYNLVAVLSMLIGLVAPLRFSKKVKFAGESILLALSTLAGVAVRVIVMTLVNGAFVPYPPPVGFGIPFGVLVTILPLIAFFNATITLYTIPLGYALAKAVRKRVLIGGEEAPVLTNREERRLK